MKKILPLLVVAIAAYLIAQRGLLHQAPTSPTSITDNSNPVAPDSAAEITRAYDDQLSNIQVRGQGTVQKILPDDNQGSRHQRFLIRLGSGQTLLIAHNVDLAPRIDALREGDAVAFYGEYAWNNKGGVIHWTHRDPHDRHISGWLEHDGRRYQ